MDWKEISKQIASALIAAALPYITGKLSFLPFLNPTIHAELWWITALISFGASLYSYNLARPARTATTSILFILVGAFGLAIAVGSLFSLFIIIDGVVPETYIRVAYVLIFVGIALAIGAAAGRMFGLEEARNIGPYPSIDGSIDIPACVSTQLFNGVVPPNGFMVQVNGATCYVNDNGAAGDEIGVLVPSDNGQVYVTPVGYKPMGIVSVYSTTATRLSAKSW